MNTYQPVIAENDVTRATFIRQTYLHVALAVALFAVVESIFLNIPFMTDLAQTMVQSGGTWMLVLVAFMFGTSYVERWAMRSTDRGQQYMALLAYVVLEAIIFLPIIAYLTAIENTEIIKEAGMMTLALFAGLSAIVLTTGKDFSFLRSALTIGGFLAIGLIVAGWLFGFHLGLWFSVAMVVLAAGSILYQTSGMVNHYHKEQYVAASLGLFASLMLMFWYILRIFMSRD